MRRRYIITIAVSITLIMVISGFIVWAETPSEPMPQAYNALQSSTNVTVLQDQWLVFEPNKINYTTGFIFYPGGRVNPLAYAPYAHAIAAQGYLAVIVPMPLNLAVFGINKANDVISTYSNVTSWAIGGHSLGGSMAAQFIQDNPDKIEGLALWASYPPSEVDLTELDIKVVTIYGTNDGLVSNQQINESRGQLPPTTIEVELNGGNHAQFGWYGSQSGDNPATMSHKQQQDLTVKATVTMLEQIE